MEELVCYKDEKGNVWIRRYGVGEYTDEMIYENKEFIFENYFKKDKEANND